MRTMTIAKSELILGGQKSGKSRRAELLPENRMDSAGAASLLIAIQNATGPLVLTGNEIRLGVIPMGREVRAFVDALGCLNQDLAARCQRMTLMVAGLPLVLKDAV